MTLFEAIILGIIQGLAEFLPISSSGHLGLGFYFFGLEEEGLLFHIAVHVATLIPVCIVFWRDIWALIKKPFQKMTYLLIVATLPAVVVGLLFRGMVEALLASLQFLAVGFLVTGAVLLFSDRIKKTGKKSADITYIDALIIGIAQGIAIFPGISRSGSTISAALARGINREDAAKFVFLMSIPAILGGLVLEIFELMQGGATAFADIDFVVLGGGFVAAMLSGYLAVNFMLAAIKRAKLRYFAYYVFVLAAFIGIYLFAF